MAKRSDAVGQVDQVDQDFAALRLVRALLEAADNLREHCAAGARLSWRKLCTLQDAISHAEQAYRMADATYGDWQQSTGLKRPCEAPAPTPKEGDK